MPPRPEPHLHSLADEQVAEAKEELKKAFILAAEGVYVEMFSKGIDAVWHEMLLDEQDFEEFSLRACGSIIGHAQNTGSGPISFVRAYEQRYGKLPLIWFRDWEGVVDESLYEGYLKHGNVVSAWICNPSHNCAMVQMHGSQPAGDSNQVIDSLKSE